MGYNKKRDINQMVDIDDKELTGISIIIFLIIAGIFFKTGGYLRRLRLNDVLGVCVITRDGLR